MPTTPPLTEPVTILITGPHNTGRTTLAVYLKLFLEEHGFKHVTLEDAKALPTEEPAGMNLKDRLATAKQAFAEAKLDPY
jgi:Flp pilus assembly CpaF family ATPase